MTGIDSLIEREIEGGSTLVVPSSPLAARIHGAYARMQLEKGRRAWRTPDVIAYRPWLEREAYRAADAGHAIPRPLRAAEEWLLWREATQATVAEGFGSSGSSGTPGPPGPIDPLAESLHRAARRLFDWDIAPTALREAEREESRLLARTLEYVDRRARERHAVGSHQLVRLLRSWRPMRPVTFVGFTECTPARRALLEAWAEGPIRCRELDAAGSSTDAIGPASTRVRAIRAGDAQEELELAAAWCRARLQRNASERVLIVIPDLARRRAQILRVFRRVLAPQTVLSGSGVGPELVSIAEGGPLGAEPAIRHALAALSILIGGAELADVSAWMRGAFWTAPGDIERAQLDAALRQVLGPDVAPSALLAALRGIVGPLSRAAESIHRALDAARGALTAGTGGAPSADMARSASAEPREWASRFELALRALGWPGGRRLS
ncbi:MAG: hypothetical protein ACREUG_02560, partial [Steroidobacteraceae bacterium]